MSLFQEENVCRGRIEVVCGSMFSGKTEELIRRLRRATFANQKVEIYKPTIDKRYSEEEIVSHDANSIPSTPVDSPSSILLLAAEADVIGIDEAQFFDDSLVDVCNTLANKGKRVIVAGLDMDLRCGNLAYVSHRIVKSEKQVLLGEKDEYEPLCRACYLETLQPSHSE